MFVTTENKSSLDVVNSAVINHDNNESDARSGLISHSTSINPINQQLQKVYEEQILNALLQLNNNSNSISNL